MRLRRSANYNIKRNQQKIGQIKSALLLSNNVVVVEDIFFNMVVLGLGTFMVGEEESLFVNNDIFQMLDFT